MPLRKDEVDDVLDAIEQHFQERLSEWETTFVDSLQRQRGEGRALTEKQRTKLDEVFERVSNQGRG